MSGCSRIGVVHPMFTTQGAFTGGGGEAVCAHVLEALQDDYEVTLLTFDHVDFDAMNARFGTSVSPNRVNMRYLSYPPGLGSILDSHTVLNGVAKAWAARQARCWSDQYDLLFSTFNEMDLGGRGIQYIHFPDMAPWLPAELEASALARRLPLRRIRRQLLATLTGFSFARMKKNITLVNSRWTRELVWEVHGIEAEVLYPPVRTDFPYVPWEKKENGFVCAGRLVPNKRVELVIEVLRRVRAEGVDTHLHIVGPVGDEEYARMIFGLCQQYKDWCTYEGALGRAQFVELLAQHRYGMHAMEHEHFGIAVAEMAAAGAVVFVPAGGGQTEIVPFPELQYRSVEEAVAKVRAVLQEPGRARQLYENMRQQASLFSAKHFARRIRELVSGLWSQKSEANVTKQPISRVGQVSL